MSYQFFFSFFILMWNSNSPEACIDRQLIEIQLNQQQFLLNGVAR